MIDANKCYVGVARKPRKSNTVDESVMFGVNCEFVIQWWIFWRIYLPILTSGPNWSVCMYSMGVCCEDDREQRYRIVPEIFESNLRIWSSIWHEPSDFSFADIRHKFEFLARSARFSARNMFTIWPESDAARKSFSAQAPYRIGAWSKIVGGRGCLYDLANIPWLTGKRVDCKDK